MCGNWTKYTTFWHVHSTKTQISLCILTVWSLSTWRNFASLAVQNVLIEILIRLCKCAGWLESTFSDVAAACLLPMKYGLSRKEIMQSMIYTSLWYVGHCVCWLLTHIDLYHSQGIVSRRQIDDIFLIFPRKQDMTFHANCHLRRQFAWNVISCFLGKIRKIFQNIICWKIYPECLELKRMSWA